MKVRWVLIPILAVSSFYGCAAFKQTAALSQVKFSFDRISDVRVGGVTVMDKKSYSDLSVTDVAKLSSAVVSKNVPLGLTVHVKAENPSSNSVTAKMVKMAWSLYLEDNKLLDGNLDSTYAFAPGKDVDVAIPIKFNAYEMYQHNAQDMFDLGLSLAGVEGYSKVVRLDLKPTVDTDLGPISYPSPITVKREVGGS
jgi:hypothetical protein